MNDCVEFFLVVVMAVASSSLIYQMLPFRLWAERKPTFVLCPKYIAKFEQPVSVIEKRLEEMKFIKNGRGSYSRGKIYGDFSVNAIKLMAEIDENEHEVKVYASFFGVLFDTGDLWQVTADIVSR